MDSSLSLGFGWVEVPVWALWLQLARNSDDNLGFDVGTWSGGGGAVLWDCAPNL